jgi:hypothetical protein
MTRVVENSSTKSLEMSVRMSIVAIIAVTSFKSLQMVTLTSIVFPFIVIFVDVYSIINYVFNIVERKETFVFPL